ncbi:MAG: protein translocase subunit SecF, partial [Alphaproteobacteria bacterium]|nr:protein translocase subunit SecF [Alphaproteobacteria bacterium]
MAFRLKLVPDQTNIDFFRWQLLTFGISTALMLASIVLLFVNGLNFGIDFRGGTTIRTESEQSVDVAAYRAALQPLNLGDVAITEVFDPGFGANQNVAQVRISAQDGAEAVTAETIATVEAALQEVDPSITFPSVESVGPKVSGELIQTAVYAVLASL